MNFRGITGIKRFFWIGIATLLVILTSWKGIVTDAQLPPSPPKPPTQSDQVTPQPSQSPTVPTSIITNPEEWRSVGLAQTFEGQKSTPDSLIFSPDGQYVITGGNFTDPILRIWSVESGRKVAQIRAQRLAVQALAIAPNGSTLISGGEDGGINGWDWPSGKYLGISLAHNGQVMALTITPDSQVLVSGALDGIRLWTLSPSRRPLYRLAWIGYPTYALAVNPVDGVTLASGDNEGNVKFWNIREGKLISEFSPHKEPISGVLFTPDGRRLITASHDRTIKIWDTDTQRLLYTLVGHKGRIRSMSMHPSGTILASASNDGVRFWNIETGELLNWIGQDYDWVQSIAFSPDGQSLATGNFDFKIRLWKPGVQEQPEADDQE